MSEDNLENLPSIEDLIVESELPSVEDFIEKEKDEVEEIIEEEGLEEEAIDDKISVESLGEILRLISDVRKDIPNIPEIKYYDKELKELSEHIWEVKRSVSDIPEQITYDTEVEAICEQIDLLKGQISELPEVKYYDEQLSDLEDRIDILKENIPEQKTYDAEIEAICEQIDQVKSQIPSLPEWVNEDSLPDLSWVGRTFSVIDDDFVKVKDQIQTVRDKITFEVKELTESLQIKDFDRGVDVKTVQENLDDTKVELKEEIKKTSDKIYEELKESALKIWDYQRNFKDDDRKLKKQILGEYQVLKKNVKEQIDEFNNKNVEAQQTVNTSLRVYFEQLQKEIAELPEVKYYDENIDELKEDISRLTEKVEDKGTNIAELYRIVEELKGTQQNLNEQVSKYGDTDPGRPSTPDPKSNEPPDPLTPTDKKYATLADLSKSYRLFVNRVEQQLYTIGGGGAAYVRDLDDVNIAGITTGDLLIYGGGTSGTHWVGIGSTLLSPVLTLDDVLSNGNTTTGGMTVGTITATNGYFTGIFTASSLNYDNVTDIYSTGIITATKGIQQTGSEGLHVTAGVSTFVGLSSFLGGVNVKAGSATTALIVEGEARVIGVLTVGSGSITLDGANNKISVGTGATIYPNGNISCGILTATKLEISNATTEANFAGGLTVGTAATIHANGNLGITGILTASSFKGDGSALTGLPSGVTINTNADDRIITGSDSANTLNGESTLTYDGSKFSVSTGATVFTNGNISAAGIVTANGGLHVAGVSTFTGNVNISGKNLIIGDSGGATDDRIVLGAGGDLSLYHDGSHSRIVDAGTGNLKIQGSNLSLKNTADDKAYIDCIDAGAVEIYHNGSKRFETTADGADVWGTGSLKVPVGSTAQRSSSPTAGDFRYNSDDGAFEGYTDDWGEIGGGGASEADTSVSSTSATAVYTVAHADYRSASIIMQIVQGSAYQSGRYMVIHDGTTATIVEEAAVATGSMLGTFTAGIDGSNLKVYVNMGSASSATVTVLATAITV